MGRGYGRGNVWKRTSKGRTVWVGNWTDAAGVKRRKYLGATKQEAEHLLAKIIRERDLELAGMGTESGLERPIAHLVEQYVADLATRKPHGRAAEESRVILDRLIVELGIEKVRDIRPDRVLLWRQQRVAQGASNKTVNNALAPLKAALRLAVRLRQIDSNPLAAVGVLPTSAENQRRPTRALDELETAKLIEAARAIDSERLADGRSRAFPRAPALLALILTGARYGELRQVTWGDIDLARGTMRLRGETTKNKRPRTLPLHPELQDEIERLPAEHARVCGRAPSAGDEVFRSPNGTPLNPDPSRFRSQLRDLYRRAGIEHRDHAGRVVHVHTMRHTFATRLLEAGVDPRTAMDLTGHRTLDMLMRYAHPADERARKAIECLRGVGVVSNLRTASEGASTTAPSLDGSDNQGTPRRIDEGRPTGPADDAPTWARTAE